MGRRAAEEILILTAAITRSTPPPSSTLAGYLPCFWLKLRSLALPAPELAIPVSPPTRLTLPASNGAAAGCCFCLCGGRAYPLRLYLPSTSPTTQPKPTHQAVAALLPQLTVGLVATFITVACIIAADTGAYFVGKNLGRTKLTDISPKKTVEGALGGLASAVAAALALRWLFSWPGSALAAAGYGVLMFFSSIFGDLIESIMKREAGMKVRGGGLGG